MTDSPGYAELHSVSNFSFLRGASQPQELVSQAATLGYAALALTDECSLAGVVRAHQEAKRRQLKLIIGSEFQLSDGPRIVLLVADAQGYGNLSALISQARRAAAKGDYQLSCSDIARADLTGCLALVVLKEPLTATMHSEGGVSSETRRESIPGGSTTASMPLTVSELTPPSECAAVSDIAWLRKNFYDRCWLAVELLGGRNDRTWLRQCLNIAAELNIPAVACGDVHMHERARRPLQDTLTAIRLGQPLSACMAQLHPNGERHLRPRERLQKIYPPELLAETLRIAERCQFSLDELRYEYPHELVPAERSASDYLRELTYDGATRRWPSGMPSQVQHQVEHELTLITELKYEHYFLTVHDIVRFARSRGILCQGRGSAANSAVCFCLGITEVDPARMSMLFERFISRERNEPPDIDVDFEHERREEVIQYIYEKYGRDRAALAATVITYQPRSAIRDVGKALGLDLAQVDRLAKSLSWWDGGHIEAERLREAGFDPEAPLLQKTLTIANELIGFPRHLSQHVGGFVMSHTPLSRWVPIENAAMPGRTVIQWDKDDLDALGLLKVDCLALGMLTAIHRCFDLMAQHRGRTLTLATIPAEDPTVYAMIQRADTIGVFQIESRAQMAMLPRLKPRCFYDLVIEVALVRPGPIQGDMVHPYLRRRAGLEPVTYPSEALRSVLERTLGVPIFQEQVMQVAMVAAGFNAGEADQLRRAMAAWRRKGGLDHFEQRLMSGMSERGYSNEFAQQIFQQILGFGEYGFPESHAASFALLVYVSAWLKCHEPAAFTCALLNSQPMGFYAPSQLVQDARRHDVDVRAVDVQHSDWDCTLETNAAQPPGEAAGTVCTSARQYCEPIPNAASRHRNETQLTVSHHVPALRLGLRMIKGLRRDAARRIVAARTSAPLYSVNDLAQRAALNQADLAALADAGALASLAGNRHQARWSACGVEAPLPLFAALAVADAAQPLLSVPSEGQDISDDYAHTGLTLRRHPLALLRTRFDSLRIHRAGELSSVTHGTAVRVAGLVTCRQRPGSSSGVTFLTLEDETGFSNVVVWQKSAQQYRRELLSARMLIVDGRLEREGDVIHVIAMRLYDRSAWLGELPSASRDFR